MPSRWEQVFVEELWRLPYFIVIGVGILLALTRWQRHSNVSLLILISCLLTFVSLQIYPVAMFIYPDGWDSKLHYYIVRCLAIGFGVVSMGFLMAASLSQRPVKSESLWTSQDGSELDEEPIQPLRPTPPPGET